MVKKKVTRKAASKQPTINRKEQRPQIDRETAVRTIENFCSCLRSVHVRLCGICNAINTMANEVTKLDGGLFAYKNFLKDELLNLERTISVFDETYKDAEAWQRFAKKYEKHREEEASGAPEP